MHTNPRKIMTKDTTELNKKSKKSGGIDYDVFIHENSIIYSYTFTDDYKGDGTSNIQEVAESFVATLDDTHAAYVNVIHPAWNPLSWFATIAAGMCWPAKNTNNRPFSPLKSRVSIRFSGDFFLSGRHLGA